VSGEPTLLVIGVESRHLRRALGPSAWVVLEELLLRSVEHDGERAAQVSVRALAASAGLAKDTVARALARLRHAGLAEPLQARTTVGTFTAGSYRLDVPAFVDVTAMSRAVVPREPAARAHSRTNRADATQLSLGIDG
jgi:hypothetical protein